jgi:hypothetical protein
MKFVLRIYAHPGKISLLQQQISGFEVKADFNVAIESNQYIIVNPMREDPKGSYQYVGEIESLNPNDDITTVSNKIRAALNNVRPDMYTSYVYLPAQNTQSATSPEEVVQPVPFDGIFLVTERTVSQRIRAGFAQRSFIRTFTGFLNRGDDIEGVVMRLLYLAMPFGNREVVRPVRFMAERICVIPVNYIFSLLTALEERRIQRNAEVQSDTSDRSRSPSPPAGR